MRALIQDRYGGADVLELADVPVPAIHDGEVLVRVRAASLNAADLEYLRGDTIVRIAGPRRPPHRIPGSDVAGVVVEVGPGVAGLTPGDEVGHSTIVLTSNTYGHVLEQRQGQVASAMDAVLGG